MRDCVRIVEGCTDSLACLLFRQPRELTPVRVGYQLMDAILHKELCAAFPVPLPSEIRLTPDDIVARWKAKSHYFRFEMAMRSFSTSLTLAL